MKRFRSNLQKVRDILQQQSRMAELELARARMLLDAAEQQVRRAIAEFETAREQVRSALGTVRQATSILMMHEHLGAAEERIEQRKSECRKAEQVCQQAQLKYQTVHSQVERIDKLIDKQRQHHRQEMLLEQQGHLDDVAIFRWKQSEQEKLEVSHHD